MPSLSYPLPLFPSIFDSRHTTTTTSPTGGTAPRMLRRGTAVRFYTAGGVAPPPLRDGLPAPAPRPPGSLCNLIQLPHGPAWADGRRTYPVELLLCDFVGAYNVGGSIRAAECAGVSRVHLAGRHEAGDKAVVKTSLGAELTLPCEHVTDPLAFLRRRVVDARATGGEVVLVNPYADTSLYEYLAAAAAAGRGGETCAGGGGGGGGVPSSLLFVFLSELFPVDAYSADAAVAWREAGGGGGEGRVEGKEVEVLMEYQGALGLDGVPEDCYTVALAASTSAVKPALITPNVTSQVSAAVYCAAAYYHRGA